MFNVSIFAGQNHDPADEIMQIWNNLHISKKILKP